MDTRVVDVSTVRTAGGVAEIAGAGVIDPATTSPTRNATVAANAPVTARNRRVIVFPL
jgi:hypothetical protein